jgi:predicted outer membrane repeat protein
MFSHLMLSRALSIIALLVITFSIMAVPRVARAATLTVTNLNDSGSGSLRAQLAAAATGDTINFSVTGVINLNSRLTSSGKSLTIQGPGAGSLALVGNGISFNYSCCGYPVTISGITIRDVFLPSGNGAAISAGDTTPLTLENVVISNNTAANGSGGGVYVSSGLTINNSTFTGNSASSNGGAVWGDEAITITGSTFTGNSATSGGGVIFVSDDDYNVSNSVFTSNSATNGGGIHISSSFGTTSIANTRLFANTASYGAGVYAQGVVTLNNVSINNNQATYEGGALALASSSTLTLNNTSLYANTAASGGAAYLYGGTMSVINSTIANNQATSGNGGGIYTSDDVITLRNSTLARNSASGSGGGIYEASSFGSLTFKSSIIALNTAPSNPDIRRSAAITSQGYNLIGVPTGLTGLVASDLRDINPRLNPANINIPSTITYTLALQPGSPAISKGGPTCSSTDQRGITRKTPCDIGAYETGPAEVRDTIGIYRVSNNTFYLRYSNTTGPSDAAVQFGSSTSLYPVAGDWNGDGVTTIGVYDRNTGAFSLRDSNTPGNADYGFILGNPSDQPFSGRWLPQATNDGVGVFRPSNGIIYLKQTLTTGFSDYFLILGNPGDVGVAGDWNGDGIDSPGVFRPSLARFFLTNQVTNGIVYGDFALDFGGMTDVPIMGDWDGDGKSGAGTFRPTDGLTFLRNALTTGFPDIEMNYGVANDIPVSGHWISGTYPSQPPTPLHTLGILVGSSSYENTTDPGDAD